MPNTMLEKLMQDGVTRGLVGSFSRLADTAGEQLGKDVWNDPEFRARIQAMLRQFGQEVVKDLTTRPADEEVRDTIKAIEARLAAIEAVLAKLTQ